jgi:hypothetical protein
MTSCIRTAWSERTHSGHGSRTADSSELGGSLEAVAEAAGSRGLAGVRRSHVGEPPLRPSSGRSFLPGSGEGPCRGPDGEPRTLLASRAGHPRVSGDRARVLSRGRAGHCGDGGLLSPRGSGCQENLTRNYAREPKTQMVSDRRLHLELVAHVGPGEPSHVRFLIVEVSAQGRQHGLSGRLLSGERALTELIPTTLPRIQELSRLNLVPPGFRGPRGT